MYIEIATAELIDFEVELTVEELLSFEQHYNDDDLDYDNPVYTEWKWLKDRV